MVILVPEIMSIEVVRLNTLLLRVHHMKRVLMGIKPV